jgi:ribosomal protein S14
MNRSQKKDKQFARCTVCGREHSTAKAIKAVVVTEK